MHSSNFWINKGTNLLVVWAAKYENMAKHVHYNFPEPGLT